MIKKLFIFDSIDSPLIQWKESNAAWSTKRKTFKRVHLLGGLFFALSYIPGIYQINLPIAILSAYVITLAGVDLVFCRTYKPEWRCPDISYQQGLLGIIKKPSFIVCDINLTKESFGTNWKTNLLAFMETINEIEGVEATLYELVTPEYFEHINFQITINKTQN